MYYEDTSVTGYTISYNYLMALVRMSESSTRRTKGGMRQEVKERQHVL